MTRTCRAGVFPGNGRVEVREFPIPDPPPGGAVLQVEAVGLCGSDVGQFHGVLHLPGAMFPIVPGHEVVGRIMRLAADAQSGVVEGDRVGLDEVLLGDPMRLYGFTAMTGDQRLGLWGGYGEYMQLFAGTRLHRLTADIPAEQLTLFEPLANALNWVDAVPVEPGQTVVIQGPGHQGLAVAEAALAAGANPVIVTGTNNDIARLEAAHRLGAHYAINIDATDPKTAVADITGGGMADVVFDIAPAAATVGLSFDLVRPFGTVVLAGLKDWKKVELVTDWIPMKGLRVFGGSGYTPDSMAKAVQLLNQQKLDSGILRGEVFDLDHIEEAMALLTRSLPGRDAVRVGLVHRRS